MKQQELATQILNTLKDLYGMAVQNGRMKDAEYFLGSIKEILEGAEDKAGVNSL
jgi:hypothetical protein